MVVVDNKEYQMRYQWNVDKFQNRLFLFREMLDDYLDDGILQKFGTPEKDPFWDPEGGDPFLGKKKKTT